jgi:hypothetical protein
MPGSWQRSESCFQVTAQLFPRRKTTARWKSAYLSEDQSIKQRLTGVAIIAALLGHISDETASRHHGRSRRGEKEMGRFPVPQADPVEVSKVRQRLDLDRLADY